MAEFVLAQNMLNSRREIMLVRHGRSALPLPRAPITAREFQAWIEEYNRTGLAADSHPPQELVTALVKVPLVFCSDYPRAVDSVRRLVPDANPRIMPLFREAGRPLDGDWKLKLSLTTWDYFSFTLWRMGLVSGSESVRSARLRARQAAEVLVRHADEVGRVLCVAHGTFNWLLGTELRKQGWTGPKQPANEFWRGTRYSKECPDAAT